MLILFATKIFLTLLTSIMSESRLSATLTPIKLYPGVNLLKWKSWQWWPHSDDSGCPRLLSAVSSLIKTFLYIFYAENWVAATTYQCSWGLEVFQWQRGLATYLSTNLKVIFIFQIGREIFLYSFANKNSQKKFLRLEMIESNNFFAN